MKSARSLEIDAKEIRVRGRLIRVACLDGEGYEFLEHPEAAPAILRQSETRIDLFTFIQKLSDASPKYDYPMEWDNVAALRVSTFEEWMKRQIHPKVRNKIRKAERAGVLVREVPFDDALIRGISAVYDEAPIRQGKRFPHYGKDLETVRRMKSTFLDRSIFLGAFFENRMIGFAKLVSDEDRSQAAPMQILSMIQHRDKCPTNALIAQIVRCCAERGIPYLWYGKFSYGRKQGDSLAEFKQHNGFEKVELPRYYVPLSVAGRMAMRLGLHRSATNWIPEPVAATYRRVRSLWYAKRFPGLENS